MDSDYFDDSDSSIEDVSAVFHQVMTAKMTNVLVL